VSLAVKEFATTYVTSQRPGGADAAIPSELRNDRRSLLRRKARS